MKPLGSIFSVLLALATAGPAIEAGDSDRRPYSVAVDVTWGEPPGPESVREEVERAVALELGERGCFTRLQRYDSADESATDLVLRIEIDEYFEQSRFGLSIAGVQNPNAPPDTGRAQVAELRAMFDVSLETPTDVRIVRAKRFGQNASYRPVMNEDPRFVARERLLDGLRRSVGHFACKGSPARFEKELAQARPAEGGAPR